MNVVWNLSQIILHQIQSKMSYTFRNDLQISKLSTNVPNAFFGKFIQRIIPVAFPIVFSQVSQVVLAERACFLNIYLLYFGLHQSSWSVSTNHWIIGLLSQTLPYMAFLVFKQIFLEDINAALWSRNFSLFLNRWQLCFLKIFLCFLSLFLGLFPLLGGSIDSTPHVFTGKSSLNFLAHFLTDDRESLNNDLYVLCGQQMVDDNVFGKALVEALRLKYFHDDFEGIDVVVLWKCTGVGGSDVDVLIGSISFLEILTEVLLCVYLDGVWFVVAVWGWPSLLNSVYVFFDLLLEDVVVGSHCEIVVDYELKLGLSEGVAVFIDHHPQYYTYRNRLYRTNLIDQIVRKQAIQSK